MHPHVLAVALLSLLLLSSPPLAAQNLGREARVKQEIHVPSVRVVRASPAGQQVFFAYYDVPAFDQTSQRHLAHRVAFRDRLPTAADEAELGTFDADGNFRTFARTAAWNFQQGAMLQWVPSQPDTVFYNEVAPDRGGYRGVLHNLATGEKRHTDRALANLSRDGRWGVAIDFDRLHDFRPGYGYALRDDPRESVAHPQDDGIWICDLTTGRSRLVLSLAALHGQVKELAPEMRHRLLVNHITFNPSADRLVFLLRNFRPADLPAAILRGWKDVVLTAARDGSDVRVLVKPGYASHYNWRDDSTVAFHADGPQGPQLYEITDSPQPRFTALDAGFFLRDGHCSYSPDLRWMLYDSYPDSNGQQHLYLYDLQAKRGTRLVSFAAMPVPQIDLRSDLHPRWLGDGRISVDSTHEGYRGIYLVDVREILRSGLPK